MLIFLPYKCSVFCPKREKVKKVLKKINITMFIHIAISMSVIVATWGILMWVWS